MKQESILKNYIYSLSYQLLIIVAPLITTPYVTRVLGEEPLGAFGWSQSICTWFILAASLGTAMYGQREIATRKDDDVARVGFFAELFLLRLISTSAALIPYVLFYVSRGTYRVLFLIQVLDIVSVVFDISWFMQGMENFRVVAIRNILMKLMAVVGIFIFVKKPADIGIYALCQSLSVVVGNLAVWVRLPQYFQGADFPGWKTLNLRRHLVPVLAFLLPQVAIQIYNEMDKTMLGYMASDISETAFYNQAQKITKVAQAVIKSLGAVMLSRVAYILSYKGEEDSKRLIRRMFRFAAMMGFGMAAGLYGIADSVVPWFLAEGFLKSALVLKFLAPTILFVSLSNVSGIQALIPMKRQKEFNLSVMSGAVCNLILNTLLIPVYGAVGAAVGTLGAELTVSVIQLACLKDTVTIRGLVRDTWRYAFSGCAMLFFLLTLTVRLPARPFFTAAEIMAGAAVYFGILFLMGDDFLKELYARILRRE